jgi:hemolysin activation/secretion protein
MPGLIRGVARTAVIAGTATTVSNRVSRRQAGRWAEQDQAQQAQQQQYAPEPQVVYAAPPPAPEAPAEDDMSAKLDQLRQLGELKTAGVLTDAEFDEQKRKLLG